MNHFQENGIPNYRYIAKFLDLRNKDIAVICDIETKEVKFSSQMPKIVKDKMQDILLLLELIGEKVSEDPIAISAWLSSHRAGLGFNRPIDVLKRQGPDILIKYMNNGGIK